jgi:ABC-2 type transport system permease protein
MNRSLVKKSIVESRGLLAACSIALFAFCWIRVWLVGMFEMSRFETVVEQFREFERFSPIPLDQLFTYAGRISLTFGEPIVLLCICVWTIARGSDCVSGEVGRGTMEMLLAQPVSRLRILWSHAAVTIAGVAALAIASWIGVYCGIRTTTVREPAPETVFRVPWLGWELSNPMAEPEMIAVPMADKVDPAVFSVASFNLFSVGVFLAGIATLMSSWDRYRWRTIGLLVGFVVVQMVFKVIALAYQPLSWLGKLTFWSAYEPERFVNIAVRWPEQAWSWTAPASSDLLAGPAAYNLLLIGIGIAAYLAAAQIFRIRDLPAPL